MRFDLYVHFDETPGDRRLDQILAGIRALQTQGQQMALDLTSLTAAVTRNTDVQASAVILIQQIAAQILSAPADQAAVTELANQLTAQADALAAAVMANTPQGPPVEPPVEPPPVEPPVEPAPQ